MLGVGILLASITWLAALVFGGYRQHCLLAERKYHGVNTPLIWRKRGFRVGSWIGVAILAVVSSAAFAQVLGWVAPKFIAGFAFGGSLALRFVGSIILAAGYEKRVGVPGVPGLSEQRRQEEQDTDLEKLAHALRQASEENTRLRLLKQFKSTINSRDPNLRWTTREIDRHITFMEGTTDPATDPSLSKDILDALEKERRKWREIAEIQFSRAEDKEILKALKEVRALRND